MSFFTTPKGTKIPLLDLRGKPYLQVAWRIFWMREEHPTWAILTEIKIDDDKKGCIGTATIIDDQGRTIAMAHKYEDQKGFADFIEKSETGAIGRALALCGYGTQFAPELSEEDRIVDSPIEKKETKMSLAEPPPPHFNPEELFHELPPPKDDVFTIGEKWKGRKFSEALGDKKYIEWVEGCMKKNLAKTHRNLKDFYTYAKFHGAVQ